MRGVKQLHEGLWELLLLPGIMRRVLASPWSRRESSVPPWLVDTAAPANPSPPHALSLSQGLCPLKLALLGEQTGYPVPMCPPSPSNSRPEFLVRWKSSDPWAGLQRVWYPLAEWSSSHFRSLVGQYLRGPDGLQRVSGSGNGLVLPQYSLKHKII